MLEKGLKIYLKKINKAYPFKLKKFNSNIILDLHYP